MTYIYIYNVQDGIGQTVNVTILYMYCILCRLYRESSMLLTITAIVHRVEYKRLYIKQLLFGLDNF